MIRRIAACTLIGAMLGAALMVSLQGHEIDKLYLDVENYKMQNQKLKDENTRLSERNTPQQRTPMVQGIDVIVNAPDALTSVKVRQFVKNELSFFIGVRLEFLMEHPQMPVHLLEGRTCTVDQQKYELDVTTVVIGETLYLEVKATPESTSG